MLGLVMMAVFVVVLTGATIYHVIGLRDTRW